jgi:iron complex outermembrane receptor protein
MDSVPFLRDCHFGRARARQIYRVCRRRRSGDKKLHQPKWIFAYLALTLSSASAQTANPSPTPVPGNTELGQVIVTAGIPIEETVLPTVAPTDSATGFDQNVVDTPRSVSVISKALMENRQIRDINYLDQFSAGVYTPSIFGAQGVPYIRGVKGELYQDGQRLMYYRNSFPPSFNGVESLDIIKGPGTPVFGPSSIGGGGYVNFATKEPFFDRWHETLTFTLGDYVPGGKSYLYPDWQLDVGGPLIQDKLAIRFSYQGREADSYYRNVKNDTQDIFGAVYYTPFPWLTLTATGQFIVSRFNENIGFNRVTQELIDSNTYIRGNIFPYTFGGTAPTPGSPTPTIPPAYPSGFVNPGSDGSYADQKIKLHNDQTATYPSDSNYGKHIISQFTAKVQPSSDIQIVSRTLYEWLQTRKTSAYGYDEWAPQNDMIDSRLELHWDLHLFEGTTTKNTGFAKDGKTPLTTMVENPGILNRLVLGSEYRHEDHRDYSDFSIEPFAPYDLSLNPYGPIYPKYVVLGGQQIPGAPAGYTASPTAGAALHSHLDQVGFFIQDDLELTKWLNLFGGYRLDYLSAQSQIPALGATLPGATNYIGPTKAGPVNSQKVWNPSVFGSLTVKPASWLTAYVTYDRTTSVQGQANFGGLPANYTRKQLSNKVELYEAGLKMSALNNTLYASIAGFHQTYDTYDVFNTRQPIRTKGLELEATWQPDRHFNATANMTFQDSNYVNTKFLYSQTGNYLNTFTPAFVDSNGKRGNGGFSNPVGFSPNYQGYVTNSTSPDVTGLPGFIFNAYFTYQFDCGLGVSIGPQVTGDIWLNPQKTLKIPAQVTWNGAIFYKRKNWEVQLNLFNLTDERNFQPTDTFASNDTVFPMEPFHADITIKLKF